MARPGPFYTRTSCFIPPDTKFLTMQERQILARAIGIQKENCGCNNFESYEGVDTYRTFSVFILVSNNP